MADRTVTAKLALDTTGYTASAIEASKATTALTVAQKETAAAAKEASVAQRDAAAASKDASATAAAASKAVSVAERDAAAAAKESAAAQAVAAKATTDAEREEALAVAATAAEREAAAKEAVSAAQITAAAAQEAAAAAKATAAETAKEATAQRDVAVAAKEAATAETTAAAEAEAAAKKRSDAYASTGKTVTMMGVGLLAAFAVSEKATTDFDKALSGVQAVANATATEMDQMRAAALQAGKDTAFTATEAADAEAELVKAGVSVADILNGGLKGALSLAAAGQLSLADAATISANAMNIFGLKGSDVAHIADVLAAGANKSAADVASLAYGLQQGGLVAQQTGLSLEDTTAALSAFADRGLKGADAGTSLKTMLERLNPTTKAAQQEFEALGISAYDQTGKFVGLQNIAGQLHDKMAGLTDQQRNMAMQTMFGSDAVRGATVLYSLGASGIKGYTDAVNDTGAAQRMADVQMNNLSGDLKQLKGSLDVALIQSGSGANSVLRDMAQSATAAVNAFASLPKPVQEAAAGFAGGAGTALVLIGGLTSLAGKAAETRKALQAAAATAEGFKGMMASVGSFMAGPWGLAIAGAAAVVAVFASKQHDAKIAVTDFSTAIKDDGNALADHTTAAIAADLASKGLYDSFAKLGVSQDTVTKAAMGSTDALNAVAAASNKALSTTSDMHQMVKLGGDLNQVQAIAAGLKDQLHAQQQATAATDAGTAATKQQAAAQDYLTNTAKQLAGDQLAATAASRANADAATAEADKTLDAAAAHTTAKTATGAHTSVTTAATAATTKATAATKSDATAAKDATKAAVDQGNAVNDAAKAADASTKAATTNSSATATAAQKKTADAAAARAQTTAINASTTATNADSRAHDAATTAADKHAKAVDASAKAAAASSKAAGDDAAAQAAAAEAAKEAAYEHDIGTEALKGWAKAASDTTHSTDVLDDSVTNEVSAMKDAKTKATALKDALDALNGTHIAAGKAAIDVQNRVADLTKALHDNGTTLDITTQKGRDNMGQVYDLATAINTHAQAVVDETGSVDAGNKSLDASRVEFDKVLVSAGVSKDKIKEFNDTLLATPKLTKVTVALDASGALSAITDLNTKLGNIGGDLAHALIGHGGTKAYATGGLVTGAGTDTSDNLTIRASPGEFVVTAAAARAVGVGTLNRINAGGGGSIVKPQIMAVGGTTPQAAATVSGSALHIENYHEAAGGGAGQTAHELEWLMHARGVAS
jgi:TP901 family phage tail tape measure protein